MASNRDRTAARRRGRVLALAATFVLAWIATAAPAVAVAQDADEADRVVAGLQAWLDGTSDLEGGFRQELVSGALGSGLEEQGRLWVKRPGRMRWDYREPESKVAIVDGDRTWLYIADEGQLYLGRLGEHDALLPSLMAADRQLAEWFEADLVGTPDESGGAYLVRLRPRSDSDTFESVTVAVRPPLWAIESAEVLDAAGNRMLYNFAKLKRNKGVPDRLFRFEAPAGTAVVGSHGVAEAP